MQDGKRKEEREKREGGEYYKYTKSRVRVRETIITARIEVVTIIHNNTQYTIHNTQYTANKNNSDDNTNTRSRSNQQCTTT